MSGLMSHYSYDVSIGVSIKLCCTMNGLNVTRKLPCTRMAMFTVLMSLWPGGWAEHSSEYWVLMSVWDCAIQWCQYGINDVTVTVVQWTGDHEAVGGSSVAAWLAAWHRPLVEWRPSHDGGRARAWSPLYTRPLPWHPAWSTPHQGPYIIRSCRSKEDV